MPEGFDDLRAPGARASEKNIGDFGDLVDAIRDVTGELTTFAGAVRTSQSAVGAAFSATLGFSANAAFRSAQRFGRDTVMNTLGTQARLGGSFSDNLSVSALRAASSIPILGGVIQQAIGPTEAAAGRVAGITTMVARAGGTITPEMRQALFDRFQKEEERALAEREEVERLGNLKTREKGGELVLEALTGINDTLQGIKGFLENFRFPGG